MNQGGPIPATIKIAVGAYAGAAIFALIATLLLLLASGASPFPDERQEEQTIRSSSVENQSSQLKNQKPEHNSDGATLTDLILSYRRIELFDVGDAATLSASGRFSDGSFKDLEPSLLSYTSLDPSVVQANTDGTLVALRKGMTHVKVDLNGISQDVSVSVHGNTFLFPAFDPAMVGSLPSHQSVVVLNRVMAELAPGYALEDAEDVADSIGGRVLHSFSRFEGYLIEFDPQKNGLSEVLTLLEGDPRISVAYPDELTDGNTGAAWQGNFLNSAHGSGLATAKNMIMEYSHLMDDEDVVISVIDDGVFFPITSGTLA